MWNHRNEALHSTGNHPVLGSRRFDKEISRELKRGCALLHSRDTSSLSLWTTLKNGQHTGNRNAPTRSLLPDTIVVSVTRTPSSHASLYTTGCRANDTFYIFFILHIYIWKFISLHWPLWAGVYLYTRSSRRPYQKAERHIRLRHVISMWSIELVSY